jgi:hypothetical protein
MLLERRMVSRKTPGDGKLEISADTAATLRGALPDGFPLSLAGAAGRGRVSAISCSCAKARAGGMHEHHFLESELFRSLVPEREVTISLAGGAVEVRAAE